MFNQKFKGVCPLNTPLMRLIGDWEIATSTGRTVKLEHFVTVNMGQQEPV